MDSKPTGHIVLWEGASLVQVKSHYTEFPRSQSGGGKRNKVSGFSRASRKRMMVLLNSLQEEALRKAKLITLTYHRNEITTENLKSNFKAFAQSIRRHRPNASAVWKLEYQQRGSPHYHLLFFGRRIQHTWLAERWNSIAEPGDHEHLQAGTRIESCYHARNVGSYLTKYLGKVEEGGNVRTGIRHWGVINKAALPIATRRVIPCGGALAREVIQREYAKRSLGECGGSVGGVDLFFTNNGGARAFVDSIAGRAEVMEEWGQD